MVGRRRIAQAQHGHVVAHGRVPVAPGFAGVGNRAKLPEALALVSVNGDHTLNAIRQPGEIWIAESIEPVFRELMFPEDE